MAPKYKVKTGLGKPKPQYGGKFGLAAAPKKPNKNLGKVGMKTTPPGAPFSPAPVGPTQPPVQTLNDSGYQTQINQLQTGLNDTNLALQNKEFGVREQFGYDPQFASNPYTRANLLQRAANQRYNSTTNSMAGRGQLYSGATDRARAADTFTSGAETDAARREYAQALAGIEGEKLAAQREFESGSANAYQDMIDRALGQDPDASQFGDDSSYADQMGGKKGAKQTKKKAPPKKAVKPKVDPGFKKPVQGPNYPPPKKGKKK